MSDLATALHLQAAFCTDPGRVRRNNEDLALVDVNRGVFGVIGDSRLYLLNGAGMQKLTHDHSPVGEREDRREMTELDAMRHPRRNEVFRDVGSAFRDKDDEEFVEIVEAPFTVDSAILLCTDGL